MDTDDYIRARRNCCRLCLAPDSECVPIFSSFASDKEPISNKIKACVNIKVTQADRLSLVICHACISYLNSWQAFKNRCIASQRKQQNWLEIAEKTSLVKAKRIFQSKFVIPPNSKKSMQELQNNEDDDEEHKSGERESMKVDLDPAEFFDKNDDEDDDDNLLSQKLPPVDGPQILTSLGLTQVKCVNPYSFLSTELGQVEILDAGEEDSNTEKFESLMNNEKELPKPIKMLSSCSICKVSFSTRANARRHEKNIHGRNGNIPKSMNKTKTYITKTQVTPEMMGIYDYSNTEKYRHLLTEQKLLFIRKNEEFLKQYQTLTCKCCSKEFPTYKNFMAHMRKKYPTLGKNLCFKCLKQFQTRAMFVSHLKKKCCINLYKLYLSDDTIPKDGPLDIAPEKMGAKDLLQNKVYICKLCSKTSRLKMEFRAHVNEDHSDIQKKEVLPGHCAFCSIEIEDPVERKRHFNNMECIVVLRCVTCDDTFDKHQTFVDHVYETHLSHQVGDVNSIDEDIDDEEKSADVSITPKPEIKELTSVRTEMTYIDSRSPQNCKICGSRYNNYNNVLRHMESKHPNELPKTYKCSSCDDGFARMSTFRDHMLEKHNMKVPKYIKREPLTLFECKICLENLNSLDQWIEHQTTTHDHFVCFLCNFQNKNIDEFKKHIEGHPKSTYSTTSSPNLSFGSNNNTTIIQSTNEIKTLSRNDYGTKESPLIKNGRKHDENVEDEIIHEAPPQKKIKTEIDLKECLICHALFDTNLGLSNHMRAHNAQQQQDSSKAHRNPENLEKSTVQSNTSKMQSETLDNNPTTPNLFRRMRCRQCQKRFSTKKSFQNHMLIDHQVENVEFIKCALCEAEFTHEKGLRLHMLKTHDKIITALPSTAPSFECNECESIFKSEEQLNAHKLSHSQSETNSQTEVSMSDNQSSQLSETIFWFQCRYCPANFNTNKKLAIHTNSHDEFDSNDYSCKDCGNVYSGRKSLWVHRYKKHPLKPEPSTCELCQKTFFDKNMLALHMKNYSHANELSKTQQSQASDTNQENDEDEPDVDNNEADGEYDDNGELTEKLQNNASTNLQQLPHVKCTLCSKFIDVESFTKHINMHEMEFYTDNPLAAMFDVGPEDPNKFYESRLGTNGEYMCDICPKTFPVLTAFKVHRNWHFRSDGKQVAADPNTTWRGTTKKRKNPDASVKCKFCSSSFINENNLKRHITELHRREVSNGEVPTIFIEKYLECQKCEMKFRFNAEWIQHKIDHIKSATPDSTFEWGCEICGKIVSRKERLIQHTKAHLKEDEPQQNGNNDNRQKSKNKNEAEFENNSQDSISSVNSESSKENISNEENKVVAHVTSDSVIMRQQYSHYNDGTENEDEDEDDFDNDDGDDGTESDMNSSADDTEDEDDEQHNDSDEGSLIESVNSGSKQRHSCDLCKITFESSKDLRSHVASHFINGPGSVTLTDISKEIKSDVEEENEEEETEENNKNNEHDNDED